MRFEEIAHNPQERLKTVLETLHKEFRISLDFNDIDGLKKLENIALENIEKAKQKTVSVFEEKSSRVTVNYLILEAIKINEEINMKKINEASNKKIKKIWGGVVVNGKEYLDNDIYKLKDIKFKDWDVAGDLDKDEGDILVQYIDGSEKAFYGHNFLIDFLNSLQNKSINEASEIEKAEYLLASKNIVDDLQGMIEDVSKIQAEKLSSIVDRIKIEKGLDAAENFKSTAASLMSALNDSLNATKDGMDNLTLSLSGDVNMAQAPGVEAAPAPTGAAPELPGAEEEPAPEAEVGPKQLPNPLGRERKEESRSKIGKAITESKKYHVWISSGKEGSKQVGRLIDASNSENAKEKIKKKYPNATIHSVEVAQGVGESTESEDTTGLKLFHVTCKSPDGSKLFGNYKVRAQSHGLATHAAKEAVMKKHGMAEWNDTYKFNVKEVTSPATPTTKQVVGKVEEDQQKEKMALLRSPKVPGEKPHMPTKTTEEAKLGSGARFKKVEKSAAKSGAKNPAAVAAAAGIKKYGVKKMEKMAHAHESVDEPNTFDDQVIDEASRKHFRATADIIKSMKDPEERKEHAKRHAEHFASQNPRFDHGRFMQACGVNENTQKKTSK